MSGALNYINVLFGGVIDFLNRIFNAIPGSVAWVLAVFAMYSSFRFLIFPIVGGRTIGGSDNAKKSVSKNAGKGQNSDAFGDSNSEYYYDR